MRLLFPSALFIAFTGLALAQGGPYHSVGGFGNVLYPGTGHAPSVPPGGSTGPYFFGRPGVGAAPGAGFYGGGAPVTHPQHRRTTVVLYPVYYGGYAAGYAYDPSYYGGQAAPAVDPNAAPSVVINQGYVPPQANPLTREYSPDAVPDQQTGLRVYQNQSHPYSDMPPTTASVRQPVNDDEPTLYLIAFKDHSIVQALGYWMEGDALHYVSVERTLNQVSLNLIDRDLSQRLNDERGVPFKLPVR